MPQRSLISLLTLAFAVTLLNAVKPLTVDDSPYYYYAAQIAQHPLDPYGFELAGCKPAFQTLAPPLLPYWWGGAIALFGERPFVWKLSLFPFSLILVLALHSLARRFARGLEIPLVLMIALSPGFLPGWNLMLDLPALALGLGALALFIRWGEHGSWWWVVVAGILAGVAMQTKYTAFTLTAAILLHAVLYRKKLRGLLVVTLAFVVFASWEACMATTYGESHFLFHLHQQHGSPLRKLRLLLPQLTTLGGVALWAIPFGLAALGVSRRIMLIVSGMLGIGLLMLAFLPEAWQALMPPDATRDDPRLAFGSVLFGLSGAAVVAILGVVSRRSGGRAGWFLMLWLILEVGGSFALSPFPAARRVLGIVIVCVLLIGRLAARTCRTQSRRNLVRVVAGVSVSLGLLFACVDLRESSTRKKGVERAVRWVRRLEPGATIYYVGGTGFQFYAEREGLKRVTPGVVPLPGEWLVSDGMFTDVVTSLMHGTRPRGELRLRDRIPFKTFPFYYCQGAPIGHQEGPRLVVTIYRQNGP